MVDNQGTVLNHITYDSFGQVTRETNPDIDFRFGYTGRELDDETGLMYYRARYFDPAVGTFVSEDPLGFDAGDTNTYRYVFNSPTNYTDPSGLRFVRISAVNHGNQYAHRTLRPDVIRGPVVSDATGRGRTIGSDAATGGDPSRSTFISTTGDIGSAELGTRYTCNQIILPDISPIVGVINPIGSIAPTFAWGQDATGARYYEVGIAWNPAAFGSSFDGYFIEGGPRSFSGQYPQSQQNDSGEIAPNIHRSPR